ncbi:hypothetical protein SARC_05013 [Sphaeroforma arctica JP610]|uniref:IMP-specific 5'-nucleotidase 1 n=1 Tax=Sphaeroforma arctica JP610 TaxID=667725 RepID=A0A0L0G0S6_9EUKA|nr:hypothetical protein SARC_05013 [Sphaeroforma arctica JP610]KNC82712.1 hypothetical protein SARC_05013 [Sphaeroforma arctica JP610]|eukprot:XP_014156614.1 hypothetical protein SARC_05013 [Sphaeroforma arctica JP610]
MTSLYRVNYQLRPHRRDELIEFIKSTLVSTFVLQGDRSVYERTFQTIEDLMDEHRALAAVGDETPSRLKELIPTIGYFFTELKLVEAFRHYDSLYRVTLRKHIPISFNDIRHILNIAQAHAIAPNLKLITFDGDQTLYPDGDNFREGGLGRIICKLMEAGLCVAVVTAAGYANSPEKYEARLDGLLQMFRDRNLPPEVLSKFYVLGGECNYLFKTDKDAHLYTVPDEEFNLPQMKEWKQNEIDTVLDMSQASLVATLKELQLPAMVIRKTRAVGMIRVHHKAYISRENLDEAVLRCKAELAKTNVSIPYCAFNGGSDAWVDIGNKSLGVKVMQRVTGACASTTLHVGDQFLSTGNDFMARSACTTAWITSPRETRDILTILLNCLGHNITRDLPWRGPSRKISLNVICDSANDDDVVLVGEKEELGNWNPMQAPKFTRDPDTPGLFTFIVRPKSGEELPYKLARVSPEGKVVAWMRDKDLYLLPQPMEKTVTIHWQENEKDDVCADSAQEENAVVLKKTE